MLLRNREKIKAPNERKFVAGRRGRIGKAYFGPAESISRKGRPFDGKEKHRDRVGGGKLQRGAAKKSGTLVHSSQSAAIE